jgi:hypothetical protein
MEPASARKQAPVAPSGRIAVVQSSVGTTEEANMVRRFFVGATIGCALLVTSGCSEHDEGNDPISADASITEVAANEKHAAVNGPQELQEEWLAPLVKAVKSATKLRIRSGGTCHRDESREETLYETENLGEIKTLVAGVAIDAQQSGFHCMCCGTPSLEFYAGDRLIVTLGFHHAQGLRWREGWKGDAALTKESATFLVDWLAKRNVKGPLDERNEQEEMARAAKRKISQAAVGMPPALAEAFVENRDTFKRALIRELPDKKDQAMTLMGVLGTSNGSWKQLEFIEMFAEEELKGYDLETLAAAAEAALLGDNRQVRRGAARLWMSYDSPLENWKPKNADALHRVVLQIEQDARYYPLRMNAMDSLWAWSKALTKEEIDRRIAAGLHDPAPPVRRKAMLVAGKLKHAPSEAKLIDVLQGKTLDLVELSDVPIAERTDVPQGFGDIAARCSDAEVAALALGYMESPRAEPLLEAIEPRSAMVEVALALLGDGAQLKQAHFDSDGNQELQLGAIDTVVRSKGKFGLAYAVKYRQATHWWEEAFVAKRLSKMLCDEKAPGSEALVDCDSLSKVEAWHQEHGAEFEKRFK